jgi:hypothetical protein
VGLFRSEDSGAAVALVPAATAKRLPLGIVDIFQFPTLAGMAAAVDKKLDVASLAEGLDKVD